MKVYIAYSVYTGDIFTIIGCYAFKELAEEGIENDKILNNYELHPTATDYKIEEVELVIEKMEIEPTPKYTTGTMYLKTEGENND